MELGSDNNIQLQDESVWVPQTPSKSTPTRLKSEDNFSICTSSSTISVNQHNGLSQSYEKQVNEDIKVYIRKNKSKKKKRYRPKVVREGITKTPKTKTPFPSTPKPHTPKLRKSTAFKKSLGIKSPGISPKKLAKIRRSRVLLEDCDIDNIQVSSQESSNRPSEQNADKNLNNLVSGSEVLLEDRELDHVQISSQESSNRPAEEHTDNNLINQKPENESKSCRRALSFNLVLENDEKEEKINGDASHAIWHGTKKISPILVYRRRLGQGQDDLINSRKFGPDFPRIFRKKRTTERKNAFTNFFTSPLAAGSQTRDLKNRFQSVITIKNVILNVLKRRHTGRKKKLNPILPSFIGVDSELVCENSAFSTILNKNSSAGGEQRLEQPSSSNETSKKQVALIPVTKSSEVYVPKFNNMNFLASLSIPKVSRISSFEPKIYCGILISRSDPPKKRLRLVENITKKFQRLYIDVGGMKKGKKKKGKSGKSGEIVLYNKVKKQVPKVVIDQETEREWNLLMQIFHGGPDEEKTEDREKWWEEERRVFRVRMLTFVAIMHIVQGDRRFSEWKGSVVDSIVGVFLTQNVSDHLSSSAFMSLASRFPIKPKNELEYVKPSITETIPLIQEVGECSRNNSSLERESVMPAGTPPVAPVSDSDTNQEKPKDWDELRRSYGDGGEREISGRYSDSVDWDAVRLAPPEEVADAIKMRGQQVVIGGKIQAFLNRLLEDHGSIDLEWLRNVPPDKAKEYLLSFYGLGLKSVECIRLLCLHHHAFPVDVNVARVAVRLGWVPLQPLPGGIEFHLLDEYPIMDTVQIYLWPRLCTLDQKTLYELHYQMITFGKVFCKKRRPSCGTCPMRGECRHYASQVASSRLSLPAPEKNTTSSAIISISTVDEPSMVNPTATKSTNKNNNMDPIVEFPPSPSRLSNKNLLRDIEDWCPQTEDEYEYEYEVVNVNENEDSVPTIQFGTGEGNINNDEIPTIKLGTEELKKRFCEDMHQNDIVLPEDDVSKALVSLTASSTPAPKLKNIGRLKTVHHVYELPDSHPILADVQRREPDDPSPYLLVIWASDGDVGYTERFKSRSCSPRTKPCDVGTSSSSSNMEDQNSEMVLGTLIIPCRTANKGRFPLNGTYFQVNEVFVDHETSKNPMNIPRKWLWSLRRRFLYCGSSASAIFTGIPLDEIQHCFWRGFICVRAFNRSTREPVELPDKFHQSTVSKSGKGKGKRKYSPSN